MAIRVDIVSAVEAIWSGEAEMLFAPASMGEIGVVRGHAPLMTRMKPGDLRIKLADGSLKHIYVSGGLLEVQPDLVTVLSDTAIRAETLDEGAILEAKTKAEEAMKGSVDKLEYDRLELQLVELMAQLATLRRIREGK